MALRNSCVLVAMLLSSIPLVSQQIKTTGAEAITNIAYYQKSASNLGIEIHTRRGGGPFWILMQHPDRPVAKPIIVKALVNDAKILFVLPEKLPGFEESLDRFNAIKTNHHVGKCHGSTEYLELIAAKAYWE